MSRSLRLWVLAALALVGASLGVVGAVGSNSDFGTQNRVLEHALAVEHGAAKQDPKQAQVSGGVVNAALDFTGALDRRADQVTARAAARGFGISRRATQGCQNRFSAGGRVNIRVNQDCSLRRQAEEVIAVDPNNR